MIPLQLASQLRGRLVNFPVGCSWDEGARAPMYKWWKVGEKGKKQTKNHNKGSSQSWKLFVCMLTSRSFISASIPFSCTRRHSFFHHYSFRWCFLSSPPSTRIPQISLEFSPLSYTPPFCCDLHTLSSHSFCLPSSVRHQFISCSYSPLFFYTLLSIYLSASLPLFWL